MKYKDFVVNGKKFKNLNEACEYFGVANAMVRKRISAKGLSLEEALTRKRLREGVKVDHLGHEFSSQKAMARAWGISPTVFYMRYKQEGWELQEALTTPMGVKKRKQMQQQDNYKDLLDEIRRLRTQLDILEKNAKSTFGADVRRTFYLIQKVQAAEIAVSTACSYANFLINEVHKF